MTKQSQSEPTTPFQPTFAEGPFKDYVERSSDLFTVVDDQARFIYVNSASEHYFGVTPIECLGRQAFDFIHEDDRVRTTEKFLNWIESSDNEPFSHENRQVNETTGEVFHLRWTILSLPDKNEQVRRFASNARDVTDLRKIEGELREKEIRLRALMSGMLDGLITIDQHGVMLEVSESCFGILGYKPEDLLGKNISMLMPEPHHSDHDSYLERYRKTGVTNILNSTREFEVIHKSGQSLACEISIARIDVPGRDEPFFCGNFRDVTARRMTENALKESESRFHAVFDQEFQYVGLLDPTGILLDVNQAALEAGHAKREDVVGKAFAETSWWSSSSADREKLREAIESAAAGEFVRYEAEYFLSNGESRAVDFSLKPIIGDDQKVHSIIAEGRDITSIKRAQKRETSMLRALASIGESASILAHEIKNPITAVNSALRAVSDLLGEDEQEVLTDLVTRMRHLEYLIRQTLSLTKPLELRLITETTTSIFERVIAMLREDFEATDSTIAFTVADDTPLVLVDVGMIEEVITNLVKNALEAAEYGGEIKLSAMPCDEGLVTVTVEDNGPGVDESIRETLFHPFVTTKASGTGIGLALSKKIVEEHKGTISVEASELGGALFRLTLPVATE